MDEDKIKALVELPSASHLPLGFFAYPSAPPMREGMGARFARGFKKISLELAQRDPATYYSLGDVELYWIELRYSDWEHVITGYFDSDEQHFRAASFIADGLLVDLKNRSLSRRLTFRVSPEWLQRHFRERLPETAYVDVKPPGLLKRVKRRIDWAARSSTVASRSCDH